MAVDGRRAGEVEAKVACRCWSDEGHPVALGRSVRATAAVAGSERAEKPTPWLDGDTRKRRRVMGIGRVGHVQHDALVRMTTTKTTMAT